MMNESIKIFHSNLYEEKLQGNAPSIVVAICLAIIMIGSIIGNFLVLLAVRKDNSLHSAANYLICSLAVTDLMVAFLVMPFNAIYQILGTWLFGDVFCQIWSATDIACCTASILHLCAIALERHQSVTKAVRYFGVSQRHTVAPKILIVWVLAICISIPPVLGWRSNVPRNQTSHCLVGHEPGYTVFATMGSFYIPLIMLLILYGRIYKNIHLFVQRSSSRSLLSSVYSEDCTSIETKRSSVFSFLRKSHSRGSCNSRKNLCINTNNTPLTKKLAHLNSQPDKPGNITDEELCVSDIKVHVLPRSINKNERNESINNKLDGAYGAVKRLERNLKSSKDDETINHNMDKNSYKSEERNVELFKSPKQHLRKINSHPCQSNSTDAARYKRSAFFRRQMAIDDGTVKEEIQKSQLSIIDAFGFEKQTESENICRRNLLSSSKKCTRRYSDSDAYKPAEIVSPKLLRPRTHTTGARVHFTEETKEYSGSSSDYRKSRCVPADVNDRGKLQSSNLRRSTNIESFIDLNTRSGFRLTTATAKLSCCIPSCMRPTSIVVDKKSSINASNPYVKYTLSVRSKVKALRAREVRAIRTLGTIVGAFVICWLPFFLVTITKPFCSCYIPDVVEAIVLWLGYLNSMLNPIIYAAFNHDFQSAFKKLFNLRSSPCLRCSSSIICPKKFSV